MYKIISKQEATDWGISISLNGAPVDFAEIDPNTKTVSLPVDDKHISSPLSDFIVDGFERYLLIMGK